MEDIIKKQIIESIDKKLPSIFSLISNIITEKSKGRYYITNIDDIYDGRFGCAWSDTNLWYNIWDNIKYDIESYIKEKMKVFPDSVELKWTDTSGLGYECLHANIGKWNNKLRETGILQTHADHMVQKLISNLLERSLNI